MKTADVTVDGRISCGCCIGPEGDRCCCWNHQDTPMGRPPKVCTRHQPKLAACPWGGCNGTGPVGGRCNRCGTVLAFPYSGAGMLGLP